MEYLNCTIEIKKIIDEDEAKKVLEINKSNLVKNGGQLHYEGILEHDFIVLVKYQDVVVGYTLLYSSFLIKGDLYVMQVAVDNNFKHLGIGSKMYSYIYKHLKNYKFFTANVNPDNTVSKDFHKKCGFEVLGRNNLGLIYAKQVKKNVKLDLSSANKECFVIKKTKRLKEREYFNNGNKCVAIDSLDKFLTIKENANEYEDVVETIYNILEKTNDKTIKSQLENIVSEYLGYAENGYLFNEGKTTVCWKIISINMPEEIKELLTNLEKELNNKVSKPNKEYEDERVM